MNNKNRILLFRDERYKTLKTKLYIYIVENNESISTGNINSVYLFYFQLSNDKEALNFIDFYLKTKKYIKQIVGLNNITDITFNKELPSISKLTDYIVENKYNTLEDLTDTEIFTLVKNNSASIKKIGDSVVIKTKDKLITTNYELIIRESFIDNKCLKNNTLIIKKLPNHLTLLKDTNPERNDIQDVE